MKQRKPYLDVLRIFAIFLVLYTHTGQIGNKLYISADSLILRTIYLYLECFRTINNPILFMISGALLLDKDMPLKELWKKRIVRFILVLILFTYVQSLFTCVIEGDFTQWNAIDIFIQMLNHPIKTSYWYLYSYISLLVMLPFLKGIAEKLNYNTFIYLLFITIVVQDLFPIFCYLLKIDKINFSIFINSFNVLYPLLGYYLNLHFDDICNKYKKINIILLGSACCGLTCAVWFTVQQYNISNDWSEKYIGLFYTITSIAIFCCAKSLNSSLSKLEFNKLRILKAISKATFGIYLLENILEYFTIAIYNLLNNLIPSFFACILYLFATFFLGVIVVNLLQRIPFIKNIL